MWSNFSLYLCCAARWDRLYVKLFICQLFVVLCSVTSTDKFNTHSVCFNRNYALIHRQTGANTHTHSATCTHNRERARTCPTFTQQLLYVFDMPDPLSLFFQCFSIRPAVCNWLDRYIYPEGDGWAEWRWRGRIQRSRLAPTHLGRRTLICRDFMHLNGTIRNGLTGAFPAGLRQKLSA